MQNEINIKFGHQTLNERKARTANSTFKKLAVQWLNQALCFYQTLCLVDPEATGLRNRHLRVVANRLAD
jgi:hypothetical protein